MESGVTDSNADTAVPAYLTSLFNDLDETWGGWFGELGWGSPDPGRELIEPGTTFRTECIDDENDANIPSNLANAFFCPVDTQPNGSGQPTKGTIVLPVQTFQAIWQGNVFGVPSPVVGDFTAAIVVAHEYGHNIVYRISEVLDIPESQQPQGNNSELIADCLAGNWAATVFQRDQLSPKDILQVATLLPIIGDPGPNQGHGTIRERATALTIGLTGPQLNRQGQPVDCLSKYWPEKFS
ncbi:MULTISPECIES: neutral zinc metallopeptidase [unclassified Gordonia (in: high G+C Gram-positive bacteria)]|uniref:neutral zinc metallopeptidase n=1 Tax=unclassified Gordonia (in: high G+C Gram-positive bacteria) TaxID=2657482 RepID=UPI001F0CDE44|nr:neutral zinc metallopeptidase [Gordonia sp. ABSL49_1]MCH5643635.1 neutral zinc metallopeptidase [Gordonia sp. ABSL49_1]